MNGKINTHYPSCKLAQVLDAIHTHDDEDVKTRAGQKAKKWRKIIDGIYSGELEVGSRRPTNAPIWVTLDVMAGGFATGDYKAGGIIQEHERILGEKLGLPNENLREQLNSYFLTEEGLAELNRANSDGAFEISTPEEGALLCVAFFLENKQFEEASEILDVITPFFGLLRFFPRPCLPSEKTEFFVHRRNVGELIEILNKIETSKNILRQVETIEIWHPLYDACVEHFLSAFDLDWTLFEGSISFANRLPGDTTFDEIWREKLVSLLIDFESKKKEHTLCRRPHKKNAMLQQIFKLADDFRSGGFLFDFGIRCRLEHLFAGFLGKYGHPTGEAHTSFRTQQKKEIETLLYKDVAKQLVKKLKKFDMNGGIEDFSSFENVPNYFDKKLKLSLSAPISVLIEKKVIQSGDTIAELFPQITAGILAGAFRDQIARRLYSDFYQGFRKRRSLLLLNFAGQVTLREIPWIRLLENQRTESIAFVEAAKEAMREMISQNLQAFPHAIIPNKLLQELEALSQSAGLDVPVVKEIAADIFMGSFNKKFSSAAVVAGEKLKGTLYARYYEIDYEEMLSLERKEKKRLSLSANPKKGSAIAEGFSTLCRTRSVGTDGFGAARNGTIIEQQQILTTQNLVPLILALDLVDACDWIDLAEKSLKWIFKRQQIKYNDWHSRLIAMKNCAYAWRQMLVYLSLADPDAVETFMINMNFEFRKQDGDFIKRFKPVWRGLVSLVQNDVRGRGKIFLGWTTEEHFLLTER